MICRNSRQFCIAIFLFAIIATINKTSKGDNYENIV